MSLWAVVVAAGTGTRFGRPKQDVLLSGVELWRWSQAAFERAGVDGIVLVGSMAGGVPGGVRRRDSVEAGLNRLPAHATHVLVHDAARPSVTVDLIRRVADRLLRGDVDGVIPGIPVRDTIKTVDGDRVTGTLDRSTLVEVQTPQGFRVDVVRRAHAETADDATDDAGMVEAIGGVVVVVPGDPRNLKVTYPEDLAIVAAFQAGGEDVPDA